MFKKITSKKSLTIFLLVTLLMIVFTQGAFASSFDPTKVTNGTISAEGTALINKTMNIAYLLFSVVWKFVVGFIGFIVMKNVGMIGIKLANEDEDSRNGDEKKKAQAKMIISVVAIIIIAFTPDIVVFLFKTVGL